MSGPFGPGLGDAVIAKWGDRGRVPLTLSGLAVSWAVNEAGELSGVAALDDVRDIVDNPEDLRGWWVTWEHPTLAPWGGVITDVTAGSSSAVEVAARGWLALLDKRLTRRRSMAVTAPAGAIVSRLLRDVSTSPPTGLTDVDADEWGSFVTWQDDGGEILDALRQIADASDQDYGVGEDDRVFRWRRQWGADRSGSVQLVQGYHLADWTPAWSLDPIITEVILSNDDTRRFASAPGIAGRDAEAYAAFGPRQQRGTYHGRLQRSGVSAIAAKQSRKLSRLGRLIEFDVVDVDDCWGWFRRGDTITVLIADLDRALVVRCLVISWDQDTNVVRVSGEVTG